MTLLTHNDPQSIMILTHVIDAKINVLELLIKAPMKDEVEQLASIRSIKKQLEDNGHLALELNKKEAKLLADAFRKALHPLRAHKTAATLVAKGDALLALL